MVRIQQVLSTVSAEFLSYRERLRHLLIRPTVEVNVQEDFIVTQITGQQRQLAPQPVGLGEGQALQEGFGGGGVGLGELQPSQVVEAFGGVGVLRLQRPLNDGQNLPQTRRICEGTPGLEGVRLLDQLLKLPAGSRWHGWLLRQPNPRCVPRKREQPGSRLAPPASLVSGMTRANRPAAVREDCE